MSFAFQLVFTPLQSTDWLCGLVDEASQYVYVCTFSLNEENLLSALSKASHRGVDVRVMFETGVAPTGTRTKVDVENSLLHLKFIAIDGERALVGSANFTQSSLKNSLNDILLVEDPFIASELADLFESLWDGEVKQIFIEHDGLKLVNSHLEDLLLEELSKADKTVDIAMYALTHPKVWAMLKILASRNVKIRLLVDRWFLNSSSLKNMPKSRLELRVLEPITLHTKLFIIDRRVVISGSANATKSGYTRNAELMMILKRKDLVKEYIDFFERIWQEGVEP